MAQTPPPTIDPAPAPAPQRGDRATFSDRVDAFVNWLITAVTQFYALALNVYNNAVDAYGSAVLAGAQAAAAQAAVNVQKWVSGTTYAIGDVRWSPANSLSYRRRTAGAGTTDPSADATNWDAVISDLIPTVGKNANYTAVRSDKGAHLAFPAGAFTLTLSLGAGLGNGWYIYVTNYGSTGATTIATSGSDLLNGETSYVLQPRCWVLIACTGGNFEILGTGLKTANRFAPFSLGSSATVDLDNFNGDAVYITGTTTITSIKLAPGVRKTLVFTGSLRLVHGPTLSLPDDQDMFLANGATVTVMGESSGAARVIGAGKRNMGFWQIQDQKPSGTASGIALTQAESTRSLNTTVGTNTIAGSSMGTNQFTLPPGIYDISAMASVYQVNGHRLRLYNVTDAVYPLSGPNSFASSSGGGSGYGMVQGRITITASKTFELRHYTQANNGGATNGFGTATSQTGVLEVYADITIQKIA